MSLRNQHTCTPKDVKALDNVLVNGVETLITNVEEGEIEYPTAIPEDAKYSDYYGKRMELETIIIKSSKALANNIVVKVENAKENEDQGTLDNILHDHIEAVCKTTFLGNSDQSLPEWVIVAKNQINEVLKTNTADWWKELTESKGRAAKVKSNPDLGLILRVKPIVCEINEFLRGGLLAAETKARDNANKKVTNMIEMNAEKACKNELINTKIITQLSHLTVQAYHHEYEKVQCEIKLLDTREYLGNEGNFQAQSKTLTDNIVRIFTEQKLIFPSSTKIALMGHNRKKEPFVMAKFATETDARTFEHQMSVARKSKAIKIRTFRPDPQKSAAFPIPDWQTILDKLKQEAKARVDTLLTQHNENEEAITKIKTCEQRIKDMKCWQLYSRKDKKIHYEYSCPFRSKNYPTAGTSSPFTLIQINDIK